MKKELCNECEEILSKNFSKKLYNECEKIPRFLWNLLTFT